MNDAAMFKFLAIFSAVVFFNFFFFWRGNIDMSESRTTLEAEVFRLERKRDELIRKNTDLERQNHRMELKLEHAEVQ